MEVIMKNVKNKFFISMAILLLFAMPIGAAEISLESAIGYGLDSRLSGDYGLWHTFSPATASLLFEYAGFAPSNSFGVYENGNPSNRVELFGGPDSPPVTNTFDIPGAFGFYLQSPLGTWYSQDLLNEDQSPHLLVFQENPSSYILAWEDLPFSIADRDYQDFVVRVSDAAPAQVPEPGTLLLVGSGLVGLAGMGRRRLKK
jgi:hypothetical protein